METYKLKHPFKIVLPSDGGEPKKKLIESIEIPDQITARHMRAMRADGGDTSMVIDLIGGIAGLEPNQMDKMHMEDVMELMGKLPGLKELSQTIGKTA